ncbi:phage head spike fiber domain-containing protein [Celeribacter sp.]|uniref:phage head spike fiber domain-containing protein n=1 Tax=Celeribacter sp. TaxID=1890673 RepID=UPI003A8F7776
MTRASGATHYATPATLATVGVDIARLETGVAGTYLLVEPEAVNLVPYARPTAATWSALSPTVVTNRSAPALGYFSGITVASGGADWHRALQLLSITSGVSYRVSVFAQSGSSGRMRLVFRDTMSGAETRIIGAFGALATSTSAAGSVANISETVLADGQTRLIEATFVPNFSGSVQLGVGPDSAVSGRNVHVLGVQIEAGSTATSFVDTGASAQTRAADVPTVNGISGTYDVTATFDSGAQTVYSAQSVVDGYWPAGLSGKITKLEFE